ncbi:MAG: beta-hydroxyacyl-ACP dehydratase [Planctomycetota bacterium]|nr:MAG: beta-hydroxyacyl-ACP dehydratase [Planctomycetota bacterium]
MVSEARAEVEALLPHRAPFLFVDRIVERGGGTITTEWDVAPELECFRGHYPGEPVLPGVLISEFCFQSGALLIYGTSEAERALPGVPVLTRIQDARFKRIVRPGATLRAEVRLDDSLANARYLSAKVTSAGETVLRIQFALAVTEAPS